MYFLKFLSKYVGLKMFVFIVPDEILAALTSMKPLGWMA